MKNHIQRASLEVVIDQNLHFASFNYKISAIGSKWLICSGMGTLDSIMALEDHYDIKYMCMIFLGQSKDKVFVFKMLVDLPESVVNLVKHMWCGDDIEYSRSCLIV